MLDQQTGVVPLVCAACLNIVGVINVEALHQMHRNAEVYICTACRHATAAHKVELILENVTPAWWYSCCETIANQPHRDWHVAHTHAFDANPVRYVEAHHALRP